MERRLTFHAGHGKTGSTSIQKSFAAARERFRSHGILYPITEIIPHSQRVLLVDTFDQGDNDLRFKIRDKCRGERSFAREQWRAVVNQANADQPEHIILSAESLLAREFCPKSALRLIRRFDELSCDEVRILCYIRSPESFYLSLAQQRLKGGYGLIKPASPKRALKIRACAERVGVQPELRIFDRRLLKNNDIVSDVVQWMDLPADLVQKNIPDANTSISAEAMELLNEKTPLAEISKKDTRRLQRRLVHFVRKFDNLIDGATRPKLHADISEWIIRMDKDIVSLRDDHGIAFPEIDYSIAGRGCHDTPPVIEHVKDICQIDFERLSELRRYVDIELAKIG